MSGSRDATREWRVEVDRNRCLGTGACVYAAPSIFDLVDGVATVIGPVDGTDEALADIVAECPTEALRLVRSGD
ncbi:ferredoxin [Pseudofrankia inefficax]|uniref:Ferredoxin n=1 Tax=Pseudofrankia inefficax (strain DSM 45817 / CECT 9037 / DDB 130130 / EuI1c) TaxID=298654 RepID=E3IV33_PSEI1|nr:ferredoxin [Pseudofrankia inefficax]ADP80053.1 hypothetical protein FraEuI1c_2003 [Pseudofrankia inefficax]